MSTQMDIAVEFIDNLKQQLSNFDFDNIHEIPNLIFLTTFKDELIAHGVDPSMASKACTMIKLDIAKSTDKDVVVYLAKEFAAIISVLIKKVNNEEIANYIVSALSLEFDV